VIDRRFENSHVRGNRFAKLGEHPEKLDNLGTFTCFHSIKISMDVTVKLAIRNEYAQETSLLAAVLPGGVQSRSSER